MDEQGFKFKDPSMV